MGWPQVGEFGWPPGVVELRLFRFLPEGNLAGESDLENHSVDLMKSPHFGSNTLDHPWVFETHMIDEKLYPVLRRYVGYNTADGAEAQHSPSGPLPPPVVQHAIAFVNENSPIGPILPSVEGNKDTPVTDTSDRRWSVFAVISAKETVWSEAKQFPPQQYHYVVLPEPAMYLIGGSYYYIPGPAMGVTNNPLKMGRVRYNEHTAHLFQDEHWLQDDLYWDLPADLDSNLVDQQDSPGQKSYLIATNHKGEDSYLIGFTDSSTIVYRSFNPVTAMMSASWTVVSTSFDLMQSGRDDALQVGATTIASCVRQIYFEEKFLYIPLFSGWVLNRAGNYAAAHDSYRQLYDPFGQKTKYGFPFLAYFTGDFSRPDQWLADPLDPYAIAAQRGSVYLRHTILMMVKNLLDWADHEFARSGPESLNRARELYLLAGRILKAPELHNLCLKGLKDLRIEIQKNTGMDADVLIPGFKDLEGVDSKEIIDATKRIIDDLTYSDKSLLEKSRLAEAAVTKAIASGRLTAKAEKLGSIYHRGQDRIEPLENDLVPTILPQFLNANHNILFVRPFSIFGSSSTTHRDFSIPPNPLLKAFGFHIEANLAKLHAGLNIALDWASQASSRPTLTPLTGGASRTVGFIDPPRYRYSYLVEKARQQVSFAQQLGAALLQAIEKGESAAYERLQAEHAIAVAQATMTLKDLSREDADSGVLVANQQKSKATVQHDFWNKRIDNGYNGGFLGFGVGGISETEMMGLGLSATAAGVYFATVLPAAIVGGLSAGSTAAGILSSPSGVGLAAGLSIGGVGLMGAAAAGGQALASGLQAASGLALNIASFQRRWEDWNLQNNLSSIDVAIADLQVTQAQGRIAIANQDREIASLQSTHATQVLNFLMTKFSDKELYVWMRDVLLDQYKAVMQIATSTALLAQRSLEFERQEAINIVTDDYWSVDPATLSASQLTTDQKSGGLLGAERLATALTQLDNNKLRVDRRHLQLSKTISLARIMPRELVELRQTGKITFNTLMEWFDWDFPGHYLRLIKSVKVSVLALIPPVDGIHATLSNSGESSVVVNINGAFVKQRSMRTYGDTYGESIALDSAYNESGLFVLDYNDAMFLPFECLGVETQWTFELPTATNRFNFDTIADVLLTIEYTALYDPAYAVQVRIRLGDTATTDTVVDAASFFPDEWYHLKNPRWETGTTRAPQQLKLSLARTLFPPNFLDVPALNATQLNVIVAGDFTDEDDAIKSAIREALRTGITVFKNGAPVRLSSVFFNNYALFFTRTGGMVSREYWTNIAGNAVSDIPVTTTPNGMDILPSLEGPMNWGDNYGSRIRGYITAPSTGNYTFWIASDNHSELWLSSDDTPRNITKIASVGTSSTVAWTANREWNKFPTEQKSAAIHLDAGTKYYVEVLHKESTGDDHVEVGWLKPGEGGESPSEVIPGSVLSLFTDGGNTPDGLPANTNPVGDWIIQLDPKIYDPPKVAGVTPRDQKPIIDRINDIVLILTVEGKIKW